MQPASPLDWILRAPGFLADRLPEGARGLADLIWLALLGLVGLIGLLFLLLIVWVLFRRKKGGGAAGGGPNLEEHLATYPPAPPSGGDRRLTFEGVPVRLRLVVIAPAGDSSDLNPDAVERLLDQVLPGLGDIFKHDKPRLRVWPKQLSYQGFATHFHRNTVVPEKPGELSPWAVMAGRAKVGKQQFMLGLAMQGPKPNTIGRRTIEAHQWDTVLRVRVRD